MFRGFSFWLSSSLAEERSSLSALITQNEGAIVKELQATAGRTFVPVVKELLGEEFMALQDSSWCVVWYDYLVKAVEASYPFMNPFDPKERMILKGVCVTVVGTFPKEEILQLAVFMGATVVNGVSSAVTHVITTSGKTDQTTKDQLKKCHGVIVVRPPWIVDSWEQKVKKEESPYTIDLQFDEVDVGLSPRKAGLFNNAVFVARNFDVSSYKIIARAIEKVGGVVHQEAEEIMNSQEFVEPEPFVKFIVAPHGSRVPPTAHRCGKFGSPRPIVSPNYLEACSLAGKVLDPASHLIYTPLPLSIPYDVAKHVQICFTGFSLEEKRSLLITLRMLGFDVHSKLTTDANVLVCKRAEGPKCAFARKHRIPVVSEHWVYDFARTGRYSVSDSKYLIPHHQLPNSFAEESEPDYGGDSLTPASLEILNRSSSIATQPPLMGVIILVSQKSFTPKQIGYIQSLAGKLGAIVAWKYDNTVTHVIQQGKAELKDNRQLSSKAQHGGKSSLHVVSPLWLEACLDRFEWVSESEFPPTTNPKMSLAIDVEPLPLSNSYPPLSPIKSFPSHPTFEKSKLVKKRERLPVVSTKTKSRKKRKTTMDLFKEKEAEAMDTTAEKLSPIVIGSSDDLNDTFTNHHYFGYNDEFDESKDIGSTTMDQTEDAIDWPMNDTNSEKNLFRAIPESDSVPERKTMHHSVLPLDLNNPKPSLPSLGSTHPQSPTQDNLLEKHYQIQKVSITENQDVAEDGDEDLSEGTKKTNNVLNQLERLLEQSLGKPQPAVELPRDSAESTSTLMNTVAGQLIRANLLQENSSLKRVNSDLRQEETLDGMQSGADSSDEDQPCSQIIIYKKSKSKSSKRDRSQKKGTVESACKQELEESILSKNIGVVSNTNHSDIKFKKEKSNASEVSNYPSSSREEEINSLQMQQIAEAPQTPRKNIAGCTKLTHNVKRVFTISGCDDKEALKKAILHLGGDVIESDSELLRVTHVIAGRLLRSAKVLVGITGGNWILRPEYILDSASNTTWLDEHTYEWTRAKPHPIDVQRGENLEIYDSPRRWRRWLSIHPEKGPFAGVKAILWADRNHEVLRLIIEQGHGTVLCRQRPEYRSPLIDNVTHIFVDSAVDMQRYEFEYLNKLSQRTSLWILSTRFISDRPVKWPLPQEADYPFQPLFKRFLGDTNLLH